MERKVVEPFLNKFVHLEKRTYDPNNPLRRTFSLYGVIKDVTDTTVVIFTDRMGAILLEDIVSIEERPEGRQ